LPLPFFSETSFRQALTLGVSLNVIWQLYDN